MGAGDSHGSHVDPQSSTHPPPLNSAQELEAAAGGLRRRLTALGTSTHPVGLGLVSGNKSRTGSQALTPPLPFVSPPWERAARKPEALSGSRGPARPGQRKPRGAPPGPGSRCLPLPPQEDGPGQGSRELAHGNRCWAAPLFPLGSKHTLLNATTPTGEAPSSALAHPTSSQ